MSRLLPGIEPGTSWMAVRRANHYTKQAVYLSIITSKTVEMIAMKIFRSADVATLLHRQEEIDGFFKILQRDRGHVRE